MTSDLLQRLVVACQTGHLSRDLGDALLEVLPRVVRNAARDAEIRRAADLIPGSIERKADKLRLLILGASRGQPDDITALLRLAARFGELPSSARHIRRILTSRPLKCQTNP